MSPGVTERLKSIDWRMNADGGYQSVEQAKEDMNFLLCLALLYYAELKRSQPPGTMTAQRTEGGS